MTTTQQQDTDCSVFNCSGLYSTHSKCVKMAPDYQDVLQNHSINSLIANGVLNQQDQELLGLNSPRGLLGGSFGNYEDCQSTPIVKPVGFQRNMSVNSSLNSSSTNWSNNSYRSPSISDSTLSSIPPNSPLRSTSLSDCSGSNSPSVFDSFYGGNLHFATESDNSAVSSPDGSLTEILNTLTLNDNFASSYLNRKADMMNMQQLQENYTPNYFQKASPSYYANSTNLLNVPNGNSRKILPANDPKLKPTHYESTLEKWTGNHQNSNSNNNHRRYHQDKTHLDRVARFHRSAAQLCDAMCTWSGVLPEHKNKSLGFSSKVFLGGVPWDISENILVQTFREFGPIKVEWPGKEKQAMQPKGYVYIIFENEKNVKALLQACTTKYSRNNNWYYKISSKRLRSKDIQVIPWFLSDTNYSKSVSQKLDPSRTVFVGALHGMLNAEGLATIMNDLFDGVIYAGIDTDKYKYPIGSGRVTFNNSRSFMKAISAGFVEIKTARFTKTVQVDPYLEDSLCSVCGVQQGPYFCRELTCFRYFCRGCWSWQHCFEYGSHKPLMRNSKNSTILGLENSGNFKCIDY